MRFFLNVNLRSNFYFFENLKIFEYIILPESFIQSGGGL